jgi:predicted nucleic acid-binding protein
MPKQCFEPATAYNNHMKPRVYIETSVISYLTARASRDLILVAHQQITQEFWLRRSEFEFYASQLVLDEAQRGDTVAAQARITALSDISLLDMLPAAKTLGNRLVEALAIPAKAIDDAYHVALAAAHGIDYLVTWNCTHIANLQMRRKIEDVCRSAGYEPAAIGTPQELFSITGEDNVD